MAALLQDQLFEISQQATAPCKDFYQLLVTKKEVILRTWKVSNPCKREKVWPTEDKKFHNEFLVDDYLQEHIKRVFGDDMLRYVTNLCQKHIDYIVRLPEALLMHIFSFLDWQDVKQVSKTCKKFQKVCKSDAFWEQAEHACYSKTNVAMEGVSSAIQRKLVIFHRKRALMNLARTQRRMSTKGYI
ncbi:F-box only protein 36-like [Erpetoichthys calabaricus]|uniref:F-box only protein 36-like n=1 Tax=Erpetoichthys calabaricus TaxID=27687 RepID=UPI002233F13D|nr:F-box only protein 36-like [Erpetoichthys calabaricus]